MHLIKAHACGNDFILVPEGDVSGRDTALLAREICHRHSGVGADGLILYSSTPTPAMRLINADGSPSEISGNGLRCFAVVLLRAGHGDPHDLVVQTSAGEKRLKLLEKAGSRWYFRAAMGPPADIRLLQLEAAGCRVGVVAMRIGNPQCVVLEPALDENRLRVLGPALERHPAFPERTNVELALVETPSRLRILIWERGVGPTLSSGTGACAAAVAAIEYAGAAATVDVESAGGTQQVEWSGGEIYLTGWAELICEGRWIGPTDY